MDEVVGYMRLSSWQKVKGNRPLLPVLDPLVFKAMVESQTSAAEKNDSDRICSASPVKSYSRRT